MNQETIVKLIVGEGIADELRKNQAKDLCDSIKNLRTESLVKIPLVHITDEVKIERDNYEIQINGKTVLIKKIMEDSKDNLINQIIKDLELSCKKFV